MPRLGLVPQLGLVCLIACLTTCSVLTASGFSGQVLFNDLPVPGATATASHAEKRLITITDERGVYSFNDIEDGSWTFQVQMFGFETQTKEINISPGISSKVWELKLLSLEEITRGIPPPVESSPPSESVNPLGSTSKSSQSGGFARTTVKATGPPQPLDSSQSASADDASDLTQRAATGLLVNGSVNNGAASAFAQEAAFGNNRKGPGSLYNGGVGVFFDTSSWDATPFSLAGLPSSKPPYNDVQVMSALGGPLGIPGHLVNQSNFFVAFQHLVNDNSTVLAGLVPTAQQRAGNFSQTLNAAGQPVQIVNPATGLLFPGNTIPVSSQAQALLNLYPLPNASTSSAYNYQTIAPSAIQQDAVQARFTKNAGFNESIFGRLAYQRTTEDATDLFGFQDSARSSGVDASVNWSRRFNVGVASSGAQYFTLRFKYEFSRLTTDITPFFASRKNISGEAGIVGNSQNPNDWGPPNLIFSSGIAGLSEPQFSRNANQTQAFSGDTLWNRGRHNITVGGDIRRQILNIDSQEDARGTFAFTGTATESTVGGLPLVGGGSDLADFLLGIPDTVSLNFGNADKYLRGWGYDAFINDDWRGRSGLSLNLGLRWEYAAPFTELDNRLANLDIAHGFTGAAPVLASNPTGLITGRAFSNSLLQPDFRGIEPRVGVAWRPRATSPLVIRAGYGVYDNTSVYQFIAMQLAQQPPFAKVLSVQNTAASPLAMATAFNVVPGGLSSTFAVDPNFRIGYAQNWDLSIQQDLPGSLVMTATYFGVKGNRLMQESLPNTFPIGSTNLCPACPAGFAYLDSNGNSTREAVQIQLRRRLRSGLAATLQYTYSKAIDDASSFTGASLATVGSLAVAPVIAPSSTTSNTSILVVNPSANSLAPSIAQNWLNLRAERGPSVFDQRHLLNLQMQYTTGEGIQGAARFTGWQGTLLREWTFTIQLTAGSGLPLTPIYLTNVVGTGVTGTIRPDLTGSSITSGPPGHFLNPNAYTAPAPGQWGDAGRNSITGPAQFGLNTSIGRTFRLNNRLTADWRMEATNVLNTVTYTSWNTVVTSPLFGVPNQANSMRRLQTFFRVRF